MTTGQANDSDGQAAEPSHGNAPDTANSKTCPTRLLSDRPAEADSFGSHGRVADAIADLLQTEDGGKTIGLEGGWGSGKSTVVRLISKQFEDSNAFCIVLFDAWAHQGDPLRRTFLELVIGRLREKKPKWIDDEEWQKQIEELAKRRKVDSTTTVPRLAIGAYLFSIAALLIPFGAALFAAGLGEKSPWNRLTIIGTGLLAVPLTLIILATLAVAIQTTWGLIRKKESQPDRPSGLLTFVINKAITEQQTTTTQSPEPTSVEFSERFGRLMDEALKGDRRLVLVLDNLDRVSHSDALSMWATLQTFLQASEHQRPSWLNASGFSYRTTERRFGDSGTNPRLKKLNRNHPKNHRNRKATTPKRPFRSCLRLPTSIRVYRFASWSLLSSFPVGKLI